MPVQTLAPLGLLSTFIYQGLLKIVSLQGDYTRYIHYTEVTSLTSCLSLTKEYYLSLNVKCLLIQTADEVD